MSMETLEYWKGLCEKLDMKYYSEFLSLKKIDIDVFRIAYKELRFMSLKALNDDLNSQGIQGQLFSIDVSDDELLKYVEEGYRDMFFKYSRILDFKDGYKPLGVY